MVLQIVCESMRRAITKWGKIMVWMLPAALIAMVAGLLVEVAGVGEIAGMSPVIATTVPVLLVAELAMFYKIAHPKEASA